MTGRRSKRLETVSSPLTLLAEIRSARAALLRASGTVRIAGPSSLVAARGEALRMRVLSIASSRRRFCPSCRVTVGHVEFKIKFFSIEMFSVGHKSFD